MTILGLWYVILDIFSISGSCPPLIGLKYYLWIFLIKAFTVKTMFSRQIKRVGRFRRRHLEISWNQVITDHCNIKMIIFMVNHSKIDKFISSYHQGTEVFN